MQKFYDGRKRSFEKQEKSCWYVRETEDVGELLKEICYFLENFRGEFCWIALFEINELKSQENICILSQWN